MPATEQTWRNLKVLHVVFGISAMLLLLATVVMLAVDHNRPWKKYQREFRALETWSATARVDEQESQSYQEQSKALEAALLELGDGRLVQLRLRPFGRPGRGLQRGQGLKGVLLEQAEQTA